MPQPIAAIPPYASFAGCHDPTFLTHDPSKITLALCEAAPVVGLIHLAEPFFAEWLHRLNSLFDAGVSFLAFSHRDGPVPIRLMPSDLHLHLGAQFNIHPKTPSEFDDYVASLRRTAITAILLSCPIPPRS